ncbi:hypothetical protein HJG60_009372 [Phyllostomus discolor]|uniref:Uncharacterized protein n=1 Tax=Phyllostomus discolor TaxID=89673 RepID=A0A834DDI1_9CHIR|nr:hypothetical protein HJG60_009372 [Phyllostomus discolor]
MEGPSFRLGAQREERIQGRGAPVYCNLGQSKAIRSDVCCDIADRCQVLSSSRSLLPSFPPHSGRAAAPLSVRRGRGSAERSHLRGVTRAELGSEQFQPEQSSLALLTGPHALSESAPKPSQGQQHQSLPSQDPGTAEAGQADFRRRLTSGGG